LDKQHYTLLPQVKSAIAKCKRAGIRVMVITGDNSRTAETICRMIGLIEPDESAASCSFTGRQFSAMSLAERRAAVCYPLASFVLFAAP
jgi:P-type Ca2+ transporter type 2A